FCAFASGREWLSVSLSSNSTSFRFRPRASLAAVSLVPAFPARANWLMPGWIVVGRREARDALVCRVLLAVVDIVPSQLIYTRINMLEDGYSSNNCSGDIMTGEDII